MERNWCRWAWENMVILSDGRVTCSCYDPMGMKELGNVHEQSLWDIWNGEGYRNIRKEFHSGRFKFCKGCGQNKICDIDDLSRYPVVVEKYPRKIYIEPSAVCNLRCGSGLECGSADFCNPKIILQHRNSKLMSFETFKRIIDEVYIDLEDLELFNYGETFLNPDAIRMIAYAKQKKNSIFVFSSTNGHYFDTEAKRLALIESGIDRVMFSVDGTDQASYERYRKGGNFELVIDSIKAIARMKKEMGIEKPFLEWRYLLFNWNDSDNALNRARRIAREIGVDRLTWHITCWPKDAPSTRFVPGTEDYEKIKPELYTTPNSNALKKTAPAKVEQADSEGMMLKKYANQTLVYHDMIRRNEYAAGYPYYAIIDPTNMCTLKCPFCPAGNGNLKQAKGKMNLDMFKEAMDRLGPYLFELSLYNWGEPFLHRQVFDMIRYAKQYLIRTQISTNLNHFERDKAEALVRSGLDELIVSVDGITPETYSKYRRGGDFNAVVRNIQEIDQAKKRLGRTGPHIIYQFLVFRHNEHEIPQAQHFGLKVGANQVKVIPAWISDPEWIPDNEQYSRYKKNKSSGKVAKAPEAEVKKARQDSCHWLWNSIVINWDGSVHPCCSQHDVNLSFGNVFEQPFEKIWNGRRYREARRFVKTRETTCDENLCFSCKIIGQRNFNDRYFKDNPIVETLLQKEVQRISSHISNLASLSSHQREAGSGGKGCNPDENPVLNKERAAALAARTLQRVKELNQRNELEQVR